MGLPTPQLGAQLFLAAAALQAPLAKITGPVAGVGAGSLPEHRQQDSEAELRPCRLVTTCFFCELQFKAVSCPHSRWQAKWVSSCNVFPSSLSFFSTFSQIYFYASYVFAETGIPPEKIPYVTLGTGMCECLTALTCVSSRIQAFCVTTKRLFSP